MHKKDINDSVVADEMVIQRIKALTHSTQENYTLINAFKTDADEYTLLHLTAKTCRISVFQYLIRNFNFDRDLRSKSKLTPLHLLVMYNVETIENNEIEDSPVRLR